MQKDYLEHHGIPGQKWGVRRYQNEDGSYTAAGKIRYGGVYDRDDGTKDINRLKNDAKRDAEDMARAKAYYGEGAGTRRKKIKNRISERLKDPEYKAEYERNLANQDMSKHQKAAERERHIEDTKKEVTKVKNKALRIGRGIRNILLGVGTTSVAAIGLMYLAKNTGYDQKISQWGKDSIDTAINFVKNIKMPNQKF